MYKLILAGFLSIFAVRAQASDSFIEGMEDIPLPTVARQIPSEDLSFGNEETRLIEAYLKVPASQIAKAKDFYLETLPQLGWTFEGQQNGALLFTRSQEELVIAESKTRTSHLRLTLTGRP